MEAVLELQTCYWKLSWVLHCALVIVYAHPFPLLVLLLVLVSLEMQTVYLELHLESYSRLHQENVVSILEYLA